MKCCHYRFISLSSFQQVLLDLEQRHPGEEYLAGRHGQDDRDDHPPVHGHHDEHDEDLEQQAQAVAESAAHTRVFQYFGFVERESDGCEDEECNEEHAEDESSN